ncbi:MAG TPA: AAA family ATPase [Ilumatobacter sp.]|nr:AAA family ATPase [Ilumatobacter sp.]
MSVHAPPPLAGRRAELQWFDDALDKVAAGNPRVIVLAGEAGVGKSRLMLDVVARSSADWVVGVGHCLEEGQHDLPYSPLAGILTAIARDDHGAELVAGLQASSPGLLPLDVPTATTQLDTTSGLTQLRFFDSLVKLFGELSAVQPVLLAIEDLHWADPATRAFVSYVARNVVSDPVALVLTVRTDELHRRHPLRTTLAELGRLPTVSRLDLDPLDTDDLGELLAALSGTPLPRAAVRRIAERSGGNPFYAEQLLALGGGRPDAQPTGGLADLLLQRVDRVSADSRRVLEVASLGGQRVEHRLLAAVTELPDDQLDDALREVTDARLLEPDPSGTGYQFQHALLAEAIAADLLPSDRRALHARYAAVLDPQASPATLARHLLGAGDKPGALSASLAAAATAVALGAPDDALAHWVRALDLWEHGTAAVHQYAGGRGAVALGAARAAQGAGDVNRARSFARLAIDAAEHPADRAEARLLLCALLSPDVTGDTTASLAEATAALAEAGGDAALAARATAATARAHYLGGAFAEAIAPAEQAAAAATRLGLDAVALTAQATALLARREQGDEATAGVTEAELVRRARECPDIDTGLWVLTCLAESSFRRDLAAGARLAGDAYAYAAANGARSSVQGVWARETLTLCRLLGGDWDAVESLASTDPLPVNDLTAGAVSLEAQVRIHRGDLRQARRLLGLAEQVAPDALSRAFVGIGWVSLHTAEERPVEAVEVGVDRLSKLPRTPAHEPIEASLVARAMGALADAHELGLAAPGADRLLAAADRLLAANGVTAGTWRTSSPLSLLAAHRSRLTESDPELWRTAVSQRAERPFDEALCRLFLAQALLSRGDLAGATPELVAAATTLRGLRAAVMLERVERVAGRARIRLDAGGRPSTDTRGAGERWSLTEREAQVLALLATGFTNRQIGESLFISARTAGVHVSNILSKLDADTRGEAVAIARQAGLLT